MSYDKELQDWVRSQINKSGFKKFMKLFEDELTGATQAALSPGDTEYEKGLVVGLRKIIERPEIILSGDTKETPEGD